MSFRGVGKNILRPYLTTKESQINKNTGLLHPAQLGSQ